MAFMLRLVAALALLVFPINHALSPATPPGRIVGMQFTALQRGNLCLAMSSQSECTRPDNHPEGFNEAINLAERHEILSYLSVDVDAVELPEKSTDTFPPLVIDGASGTGKTQQAFALLKKGHPLVYVLLVSSLRGEQAIYNAMRDIAGDPLLFKRLVAAQNEIESNEGDASDNDIYSIEALRSVLYDAQGRNSVWPAVCSLIVLLAQYTMKYSEVDGKHELFQRTRVDDFKKARELLKGVVFFADEALPQRGNKQKFDKGVEFIRFVRNFVRALEMKAVLVGTSATAANMISETGTTSAASREGVGDPRWIDVHFLWRPPTSRVTCVAGTSACEVSIAAALKESRPLLLTVAEKIITEGGLNLDTVEDRRKFFQSMGESLKDSKKIVADSDIHWLCGSHMEGTYLSPSSFLFQSAELVRSHFYEPAIAVESDSECPYGGRGLTFVDRLTRDMRISINQAANPDANRVFWLLGRREREEIFTFETAAIFSDFESVAYSMTNSVQQCLAREPLLALALSLVPKIKNPSDFSDAVTRGFRESVFQRTVGSVGGEVHEIFTFAMLQLACRNSEEKRNDDWTTSLWDFLLNLSKYILFRPNTMEAFGNVQAQKLGFDLEGLPKQPASSWDPMQSYKEDALSNGPAAISTAEIKDVCEKEMMLWLVPACSAEKLQAAINEHPNLFDGMHVAGLVPTARNASFDSEAFRWEATPRISTNPGGSVEPLKPCWKFEFEVRSKTYSLSEAANDLAKKCKEGCESHALLVAITGKGDNEWIAWKDENYLRVVLKLCVRKQYDS